MMKSFKTLHTRCTCFNKARLSSVFLALCNQQAFVCQQEFMVKKDCCLQDLGFYILLSNRIGVSEEGLTIIWKHVYCEVSDVPIMPPSCHQHPHRDR